MPKPKPKPTRKNHTPHNQQAKQAALVTNSVRKNARGRGKNSGGGGLFSPIQPLDVNDNPDVDNAVAAGQDANMAARGLMMLQGGNDDEARRQLVTSVLRRSNRLKESARVNQDTQLQRVEGGFEVGKEAVKLSEWMHFSNITQMKGHAWKKCVYVGILLNDDQYTTLGDLDDDTDYSLVDLGDVTIKFGYTYTEGQTPQCLDRRMAGVTSTTVNGALVRCIKFGDATTEQAVRMVEKIAKFVGYQHTFEENGAVRSCYCGKGELYYLTSGICNNVMEALLDYAQNGTFEFTVGDKIITHDSVDNKANLDWKAYCYKTNYGTHASNEICPWNRKKGANTLEVAADWNNFVSDLSSTCPCLVRIGGIQNIGSTCYISALLHILSCVSGFLDEMADLLNRGVITDASTSRLAELLLDVLFSIGTSSRNVTDPSEFKRYFDEISSNYFGANQEHDPAELLTQLFDYLSESAVLESLIKQYFYVNVEITRTCNICQDESTTTEEFCSLQVAIRDADNREVLSVEDLIRDHLQDEDILFKCGCQGQDCDVAATRSFKVTKR